MSNALLMAGRRVNLLSRARSVTASSGDSLYTIAKAYDNDPGVPFRYGSAGTDVNVTGDLALYDNGDMEVFSGGAFTGWSTSGPGALAQTVTAHGGSSAASIQRGASLTMIYRDVAVRAGEELRFDGWHRRGSAGTATSTIRFQNRSTGKFLTSAGAWQTASADTFTTTSTTYQNATLTFSMESIALCQADEVNLRIMLLSIGGAASTDTAFFDDIQLNPTWDFFSVHGHNIPPGLIVPEIHSSTDNFSGSDTTETPTLPAATITAYQPSFWAKLGSRNTRRYCRMKFVGTPDSILYFGEVAVLQSFPLSQCFNFPVETSRNFVGQAEESGGGNVYTYSAATAEPRTYVLDYQANTLTNFDEAEWLIRRARTMHYPVVFVPNDTETVVLHGRFDPSFTSRRISNQSTTYPQKIKESAFPPAGL